MMKITMRGHMAPPPLQVCNGLARPADESRLARNFGKMGQR